MAKIHIFIPKCTEGGGGHHLRKYSLKKNFFSASRYYCYHHHYPARAQSAGPKGLRVTGRRCPHSGKGEGFLTGQLNFFTETAVTPERRVEKLLPWSEINRHAKG